MRNKNTIKLIKLYQKHKRISGRCHFIPSCSNYAIEAYQKFNWFYASILTAFRIIRCTPFTKRKVDPVPLTKEEKKLIKEINLLKQIYDPIYIDLILNHKYLKNEDLLILTIQYLYGYNYPFNTSNKFNRLSCLGPNFVKTNIPNNYTNKITELPNSYLDILIKLNELKVLEYTFTNTDYSALVPSASYPINYYLTKANLISLDIWEQEIKNYFTDKTLVGFENIDNEALEYFKNKWQCKLITPDLLNHKYIDSIQDKVIIVLLDNTIKNAELFHLNCIVRFYDENEQFSINNYNLYIPKKRGE